MLMVCVAALAASATATAAELKNCACDKPSCDSVLKVHKAFEKFTDCYTKLKNPKYIGIGKQFCGCLGNSPKQLVVFMEWHKTKYSDAYKGDAFGVYTSDSLRDLAFLSKECSTGGSSESWRHGMKFNNSTPLSFWSKLMVEYCGIDRALKEVSANNPKLQESLKIYAKQKPAKEEALAAKEEGKSTAGTAGN